MQGAHADLFVDGVAVRDRFVAPHRVRTLNECVALRRDRGDFRAARVGAEHRLQQRKEIRGDSTCWLVEPLFSAERALLRELDKLRLELNRAAFLGLFDIEMHYAWYPPGAGYARHVDQLQEHDERVLSAIVYLNETWTSGDGGELRLYGAAGQHRDIEPIGGRLVYFLSAAREHAVMPTQRDRLSVSGWLRRRG